MIEPLLLYLLYMAVHWFWLIVLAGLFSFYCYDFQLPMDTLLIKY